MIFFRISVQSKESSNLACLEEITRASDINNPNEEGQCFVHVASGAGQLDVLKFLRFKGADLHRLDTNGESAVHWAAKCGHPKIIEFLYEHGLSVNSPNKFGDTPLHLASKNGHAKSVAVLCKDCIGINQENEEGKTPLHLAASQGHLDAMRCLIEAGADADAVDKHGCTALHLALRRHHTAAAILLLQDGCNMDVVNDVGEAPIHIVAREGLLAIAQTLCAFGCKVETPNKHGQYPLHIAARAGHTETVRCLCLAGCNVELKDGDGIAPEIIAVAHEFNEMADLLDNIRNVQIRGEYISQLVPTTRSISKIKLKLFGHSGVGKTMFVESLKCGYFSSWFRRSVGSMSPKISRNKSDERASKSSIELNSPGPEETLLSFETNLDTYTHGIDVQHLHVTGIGDISIWEFSGHEPYYVLYDNFIGNTNCIHLVFFRLSDPYDIQTQQVWFWLAFLQSRIAPQEPLGFCGKSGKAARIALVATHADTASCHRVTVSGEYVSSEASSILKTARQMFGHVFELHDTVFVMDAHVVGSPAMKALKAYVTLNKDKVTQGLPKSTGFLEAVCSELNSWRKSKSEYPVLSWMDFTSFVHTEVNPLAGEVHMKELIRQLQIMGEVVYVSCDDLDLVILDPSWLCGTILGYLLSQDSLDRARVTGIYSPDNIQLMFPDADGPELLLILEALQLCTKGETDGEIEYEFPCFNFVETLEGLWIPPSSQYIYGGVILFCQYKYLLQTLLPRLQVHLRRSARENNDPENDLYQWYRGSKFCNGLLEGLICLDPTGNGFEIKVRGPGNMKAECFYFLEDLISITEQMFAEVCPGLLIERHILSSSQLEAHSNQIAIYSPEIIMRVLLEDGVYGVITNDINGVKETVLSLCFFDTPEVLVSNQRRHSDPESIKKVLIVPEDRMPHSQTTPFLNEPTEPTPSLSYRKQSLSQLTLQQLRSPDISFLDENIFSKEKFKSSPPTLLQDQNPVVVLVSDLHASQMSLLCCQCLCAILDPPESMGKDWCMFGVLLGMTEKLPKLDPGDNPAFSPTACIIGEWIKRSNSTIGELLKKLEELERIDAMNALLSSLPMFKIVPSSIIQSCQKNESDMSVKQEESNDN